MSLPFGLRSALALFNQLADAIQFILQKNYGVEDLLHYLDDFFTVGPPSSNHTLSTSAIQKATILAVLDALNIPVAEGPGKVAGPATQLKPLGILLDSEVWTMSLPEDKLSCLRDTLRQWVNRASCTKWELLSLIGSLAFAAKVV